MAMTDAEATRAASVLSRGIYVLVDKRASMNLGDLKAAVLSIDTSMDAIDTGGAKIKVFINQSLPEPYASRATIEEKALALKVWADWQAGLI